MITLKLNEQLIQADDGDTIWKLLQKQGFTDGCYAVALNQQFVPRHQYVATSLSENDQIDIIQPMQGG